MLFGIPFPEPQSRKQDHVESWYNCRAHFFALLRDHSFVLLFSPMCKSSDFICFLVAKGERPTVIPVPPSWLEVQFTCSTPV